MSLVTESDREHFEKHGYVVIEDVVPERKCEAVVDDIWEFLGNDPDDRSTWYDPPDGLEEHSRGAGVMEMYFAQSMWDVRQHPAVYQAFSEILEEERLWTSIDRVNYTPPVDPEHADVAGALGLHWDLDTETIPDREVQPRRGTEAVPYGVQGVLHLRDTSEEQGGFRCVPEAYRDLYDGFLDEQEGGLGFGEVDPGDREIVNVAGGQGDLLVWDSLLLHGNGRNTADEPRFAQYVTMYPARFDDREERELRAESWRKCEPLSRGADGDPRGWEAEHHGPGELTSLGQKLLGLDAWSGWRER